MTGRFIVLEGGDGSGKSTHASSLAAWLRRQGHTVVETREPGGTPLGLGLRALLLDGAVEVGPLAEALVMAADRAQHIAEVVRPALARGEWVVSDRHVPSSLVYQGVVRKLGVESVGALSALAVDGVRPDLVIVLDISDAVAGQRRHRSADRLEREGDEFHSDVRGAYRALAAAHGWCLVDGAGPADDVAARIVAVVTERLTP